LLLFCASYVITKQELLLEIFTVIMGLKDSYMHVNMEDKIRGFLQRDSEKLIAFRR
jgi:hypothetical protein